MKIDVIVVYVPRYRKGHELDFVPPRTGIHLAAITPRRHRVRVIHQQLQAIDLGTDADLIALSFFSGFAPEEFRLAGLFRARGTCRPTCGSGRNTTTSSGPGTVCRCHPAAECMPEALGGAGHCPATGTTAAKRIYSVIMSTMSTSQNG